MVLLAGLAYYHSFYVAEVSLQIQSFQQTLDDFVNENVSKDTVLKKLEEIKKGNIQQNIIEENREKNQERKLGDHIIGELTDELNDDLENDLENDLEDDLEDNFVANQQVIKVGNLQERFNDLDDDHPDESDLVDAVVDDLKDDLENDVEDDHVGENNFIDDYADDLKDDLEVTPNGDRVHENISLKVKNDDKIDDQIPNLHGNKPDTNPEKNLPSRNDNKDDEVEPQSEIKMYPSLKEMEKSVINGTFDWSKTARSILFLKKHKCASSTLRQDY